MGARSLEREFEGDFLRMPVRARVFEAAAWAWHYAPHDPTTQI
jgi:hypothetical protein